MLLFKLFVLFKISFDIFSVKNFQSWQKVLEDFYREVTEIEDEAKIFINQSFKELRFVWRRHINVLGLFYEIEKKIEN